MIGEVIAGRYELEELVGSGGMSSVYKALDRMLERNVALKLLHPHFGDDSEYVERFRREARLVAQLSHPHIVTVIDRGESEGRQYIVFEYVDGESLKELLDRTGPLPARRAAELGAEIADALAFAHAQGLVHRDVKPQNVLLTRDGEAKVTDFGIARSLDVEHGVTQTGTVLGTSNYLSPEQAAGRPVTPATDVYSLGVVLYELLTGEVPFPGDNVVAVAMKHVHEEPPSLLERRPELPLRLVAAVERALEKDPARRFHSMADFAAELRASVGELGAPDTERTFVAPGPVLRQGVRRRAVAPRRRGRLWALLVLLAAAAIVAGVLALGGSKGTHGRGAGGALGTLVPLHGVGDWDPQGNGGEHAASAPNATDGNPQTYWDTEIYATPEFGNLKQGLGLVLQASQPVKLARLVVTTTTPGFTAQILAGDPRTGRPLADSAVQRAGTTTTFELRGATAQTYVVWLTQLPSPGNYARIDEVRAYR